MWASAEIATIFASLDHATDAWEAQALSARVQSAAESWSRRLDSARARESRPGDAPPQTALPFMRLPRTARSCRHCHGPVEPHADHGPVPLYCSERCRKRAGVLPHERRRWPRSRGAEMRARRERESRAGGRQVAWC